MALGDRPQDQCGVFGIFAPERDVARLTFFALFALQHRGQESAGIAVNDHDQITVYKDVGLVSRVFSEAILRSLTGQMAIGHTRYSTTGSTGWHNAQPAICSRAGGGSLALAHNGNLVNTDKLRMDCCMTVLGWSPPRTPRSSLRSSLDTLPQMSKRPCAMLSRGCGGFLCCGTDRS